MKLTDLEERQLECLIIIRKSKSIPMSEEHQNKLESLNNKYFHNNCSNPCCKGYEAKEDELICPLCGNKIFKLI